jgi:uncharacterized protein (DUF1499 family)
MSWKTAGVVLLVGVAGFVVTMVVFRLLSRRPDNLGAVDGKLASCPDTPNCVATQSGNGDQRMEPIPFRGTADEATARLKRALGSLPRTRVVSETENYLHAECTSLVFRFVDDVEFLVDADAEVIHFRSASRAGRSDLGVNRRRMEEVRRLFEQDGNP